MAGFVIVDQSGKKAPALAFDGLNSIHPGGSAPFDAAIPQKLINQSLSGDRGSARLKRDTDGVQMNELGVGGQIW